MTTLRLVYMIFAAFTLAVPALGEGAANDNGTMDHSAMDHSKMEMHDKREATGTGVIHSVNLETRSINLTHDPMPEFGWPEMTMDLPVTKKVDLSGIKSGDKVGFKLKLGRDKKYRIIELAPGE